MCIDSKKSTRPQRTENETIDSQGKHSPFVEVVNYMSVSVPCVFLNHSKKRGTSYEIGNKITNWELPRTDSQLTWATFFSSVGSTNQSGILPPAVPEVAQRHSVLPLGSSITRSTHAYLAFTPLSSSLARSASSGEVISIGIVTTILTTISNHGLIPEGQTLFTLYEALLLSNERPGALWTLDSRRAAEICKTWTRWWQSATTAWSGSLSAFHGWIFGGASTSILCPQNAWCNELTPSRFAACLQTSYPTASRKKSLLACARWSDSGKVPHLQAASGDMPSRRRPNITFLLSR